MLPRQLPRVQGFSCRVDSSLGEAAALPAEVVETLSAEAMSAAAEEGASAVDVCLSMLPRVQEASCEHFPGQVGRHPLLWLLSIHQAPLGAQVSRCKITGQSTPSCLRKQMCLVKSCLFLG